MQIITSELIRPFDIDGTLILHRSAAEMSAHLYELVEVFDEVTEKYLVLGVNTNMVRLLKEEKLRGGTVIAWSRGGYQWAANVIRALDLEQFVDIIMSKPLVYFDDMQVESWLKDRVFIGPYENYKQVTKEK